MGRGRAADPFVLILLALAVLATQLPSFHVETIDWDEHTFMLMVQDVLRGGLCWA